MKILKFDKRNFIIKEFDIDLGVWINYATLKREYDESTNTYYLGYRTEDGIFDSVYVYSEMNDEWIYCWNGGIDCPLNGILAKYYYGVE